MNKLRMFFAVSALGVIAASVPAFAADTDPIHLTVPFAFKAGRTMLPAGDYVVVEETSGVLVIRGSHGNAILLTSAGPDSNTDKAGAIFAHNDQGYVLTSVHAWGKISSSVLPLMPGQDK